MRFDRLPVRWKAGRVGKGLKQRLTFSRRRSHFLQARVGDLEFEQARGVQRTAAQRRTTSSRLNSLNSTATTADASTTLSLTIFADQPSRFVPPRQTEIAHSRDNLVNAKPASRGFRRMVDQRPQFALQRPVIGLGSLAQALHLLLGHALDRKIDPQL